MVTPGGKYYVDVYVLLAKEILIVFRTLERPD